MAGGGSVSHSGIGSYPQEARTLSPPGRDGVLFCHDGPDSALEQARKSAGRRDIRIAGGADAIRQYLNLVVIDELEIALAPVLFGGGRRLLENLREPAPRIRIDKALDSPAATHLRYTR